MASSPAPAKAVLREAPVQPAFTPEDVEAITEIVAAKLARMGN
jgi:hypothetical protein